MPQQVHRVDMQAFCWPTAQVAQPAFRIAYDANGQIAGIWPRSAGRARPICPAPSMSSALAIVLCGITLNSFAEPARAHHQRWPGGRVKYIPVLTDQLIMESIPLRQHGDTQWHLCEPSVGAC
jgi:hypothetical protein